MKGVRGEGGVDREKPGHSGSVGPSIYCLRVCFLMDSGKIPCMGGGGALAGATQDEITLHRGGGGSSTKHARAR